MTARVFCGLGGLGQVDSPFAPDELSSQPAPAMGGRVRHGLPIRSAPAPLQGGPSCFARLLGLKPQPICLPALSGFAARRRRILYVGQAMPEAGTRRTQIMRIRPTSKARPHHLRLSEFICGFSPSTGGSVAEPLESRSASGRKSETSARLFPRCLGRRLVGAVREPLLRRAVIPLIRSGTEQHSILPARIFMLTIRPSDSNIWRESRLVAGSPHGETSDLRLQEERPNGIPEV